MGGGGVGIGGGGCSQLHRVFKQCAHTVFSWCHANTVAVTVIGSASH